VELAARQQGDTRATRDLKRSRRPSAVHGYPRTASARRESSSSWDIDAGVWGVCAQIVAGHHPPSNPFGPTRCAPTRGALTQTRRVDTSSRDSELITDNYRSSPVDHAPANTATPFSQLLVSAQLNPTEEVLSRILATHPNHFNTARPHRTLEQLTPIQAETHPTQAQPSPTTRHAADPSQRTHQRVSARSMTQPDTPKICRSRP
jgi:hypothetical protein